LDNSGIYLDEDDFKELFKKINFEISPNEIYSLFKYRNDSYDEGYYYGKKFLENCNLNDLSRLTEKTLDENEINNYNKNAKKNANVNLKNIKDIDNDNFNFSEINSQLKVIKNEGGNFVKNDKKNQRENSSNHTNSRNMNINILDRKGSRKNMLRDNLSKMDSDSKLSNTLSKKIFY